MLSEVTGEPSNAVIEFPKAVKDGFPIELSLAFVSSTPLVLPIMVIPFFGDTSVILNEEVIKD